MSRKFKLSKEVLFQEVSGEMVLLDLANESYFGLNKVGTRIWQLLKEDKTLSEVFDVLGHEYEVGDEQLRSDVTQIIDQLLERGLLTEV
jgi:hypothetical protein